MSSEAKAPSTPGPQENEASQPESPPPMPSSPRRGEIWDVNWSPGRGAEQKGTRPALIIQNDRGNTSPSYPMTIEKSRLIRRRGFITSEELSKVDVALRLSLNLLT